MAGGHLDPKKQINILGRTQIKDILEISRDSLLLQMVIQFTHFWLPD